MNKKIIQLFIAMFFVLPGVMAQEIKLETVTDAVPGSVSVNLDMLGFTGANGSLGAITLQINYDTDLLSYTEMSNVNTDFSSISD